MDENSRAEWLKSINDTGSHEALVTHVGAWHEAVKKLDLCGASLGFEFYMASKQWDNARGSLIRSYGRHSDSHSHMVDFLDAAVAHKRTLQR
jgi:hypothetical protein